MKIKIKWDPNIPDIVYDVARMISASNEEYENIEDCVHEEIERFLIYTENCWALMKKYQNPIEADINEAIEEFEKDIWNVLIIEK